MYLGFLSSPYLRVHPSTAALASRWSSAGSQAGKGGGGCQVTEGSDERWVWRAVGAALRGVPPGPCTGAANSRGGLVAGHVPPPPPPPCQRLRLPRLTLVRVSRAAEASIFVLTVLGGKRQHSIAACQACLGVGNLLRQACRGVGQGQGSSWLRLAIYQQVTYEKQEVLRHEPKGHLGHSISASAGRCPTLAVGAAVALVEPALGVVHAAVDEDAGAPDISWGDAEEGVATRIPAQWGGQGWRLGGGC